MPSHFIADLIARRTLLSGIGALATSTMLSAGFASPARAANGTVEPGNGLDYADPRDNLYAFGKIWSGYDAPVIGAFHGLMYARFGHERMIPVFGYTGTGVLQARIDDNKDLLIKSRETGYFTDLETGDILETWFNPFTEETVEVYHFYNDVIGGRIGPEIPKFFVGAAGDSPTLMNEGTVFPDENGNYPFVLPFQQYGPDLSLAWDYTHEYTNPVTPEGWPKSSTGPKIAPSEHFTFSCNKTELEDRSLPTVRMHAGFSRISEFWPFMRMGGSGREDGVLFGRMHSHKGLSGYGEVPRKVLDYIEKHAPEYLTIPDGWPVVNDRLDTWSAYAQDIPPEADGYAWETPDPARLPKSGKGSAKG